MIHFKEIGPDNWRLELKVASSQEDYVANARTILARAYAYRTHRSRACLICHDDIPIGMALYYDCPELDAYDFCQFFIDERYQGHGYGKAAVKLLLNEMRLDGRFSKVILCYCEKNMAAKTLYEQFGFIETGRDQDEIIMELRL